MNSNVVSERLLLFDIMAIDKFYKDPEKIKTCIINGCEEDVEPPDYVCGKCIKIYGDDAQCRGQTTIAANQIYHSHGIKIKSFHKMVNDAIEFLNTENDLRRADVRKHLKKECRWKNQEAINMATSIAWQYMEK